MSENVGVSRAKLKSTENSIIESNSLMATHLQAVLDAVSSIQTNYQSDASKNLGAIAGNMQTKFALLKKEVDTFASWLNTVHANYQTMAGAEEDVLSKINSQFK